ncbi:hypothetical protein HALLA_09880 [Halostagnicola larsenii XH-48]|uniref:Uncharacterized protein n=1 Tax=Halostagnicola larsenii XH-48 TaxID=797299 RepID=W0JPK7_9EURY|nr:hypothetical protein [Halostagnicola larsenii]AHF99109.1 hypothetical protein HALLA_09880 [Halostagnicola larsenii XH-48]
MSGTELTFEINRDTGESLEANSTTIEAEGSFAVRLRGHNVPAHAHCRLEGDLSRLGSLEQPNYYVEPNEEIVVPISVPDIDEPVSGTLEVSIGYGAEAVQIDVEVVPGPPEVDVDESLSEPHRPEPEPSLTEAFTDATGVDPATLGVVALAGVALAVAALTAGSIGGPIALVGFLIVAIGIVVAAGLLLY